MTTSDHGIALITGFEGLVLHTYLCPAHVKTIGYGHTGPDVHDGMVITKAQAVELLKKDLARFEHAVSAAVKVALTQGMFDALVSFTYNCGDGALLKSNLLKRVNKNPHDPMIRAEFAKWNKAGGKVLSDLVKRRDLEATCYFS